MATTKEQKELAAQIRRARELNPEFLDCRSLGHAWREVNPDFSTDVGEVHEYQCMRCKTLRGDVVSPKWGELLSRHYRHVPGYIFKRPDDGTRVFSAAALRAERVRRFSSGAIDLWDIDPLGEGDINPPGELR